MTRPSQRTSTKQVNHNADVNLQTGRGACALSEAFNCGQMDAFALLLRCGANPLCKSPLGETLLLRFLASLPMKVSPEVSCVRACDCCAPR